MRLRFAVAITPCAACRYADFTLMPPLSPMRPPDYAADADAMLILMLAICR